MPFFTNRMESRRTVAVMWQTFQRYRWHVAALAILGFLSAILEGIGINAAIPLISFFMGDTGTGTDFITNTIRSLFAFIGVPFTFRYLLAFILILFLLRALSVAAFGYIRGWISADFLSRESEDMLRRTLLASWPFLLKEKIGTLHNVLVRDIQRTGALMEVTGQVIQSFSGFLMYLLVALNISAVTTLATLVGGIALMLIARPLLIRSRQMAEETAATEKTFSQFLSEHIIGMKMIKAQGAERRAIVSGNALVSALRQLFMRGVLVRAMSGSLFQPFSLIFVIVLFAITYPLPGFSIISFAATLYLIQKIFTYLESGQAALHSINELVPYAASVAAYKQTLGEHREHGEERGAPFVFADRLEFERVSFSYSEEAPVLHEVSFWVRRGETVGLIGPSGAGKTSVADLILRLFKPTSGRISLDGKDAHEISLESWRTSIGYVSQDVFLFNGSIEENIRMYRTELSHEDIVVAARQANAYDFIALLPQGFDTHVGDRGVMLSGGQRQRIALARALAGQPELLVLDEATSALDAESERLIQEAIARLHGETTVFIIAHRLSTIERADRLLVLERGMLMEQGTPHELLQNPESYYTKNRTRGVSAS